MSTITEKIDAILQQRSMSRRQLAIAANISPSTFQAAMARGKNMTVEMLQAVAAVLGIPVSSFFNLECISSHGDVQSDINQTMRDFVDELRGQAQEFGCSLGSLLDVSPEYQAGIDDSENEVHERCHAMDWGEHDPYGSADGDELREELYEEAETKLAKLVLHAILDAAKTKMLNNLEKKESKESPAIDAKAKAGINDLLSLYLQFNGKGQQEILEWVQNLARLMVQVPAYRQHQPAFDDLRDVFGGRVSFDNAE